MPAFKSHKCYWQFADSIINKYRYAIHADAAEFLQQLEIKLKEDPGILKKGTKLCRAQIGHDFRPLMDNEGNAVDQIPCAFKQERMKPLRNRAKDGRINPKGIPCLYLSTNLETAIAEVRPAQGQFLSLGYFEVLRDCTLANFTVERNRHIIYLDEPPEEKIEEIVLGDLTNAFSKPVNSGDQTAHYAPTQVIAEHVRRAGYDGIYYRSNLGPKMNIALFDLDVATLIACDLFIIDSIKYTFTEADNRYFVPTKTGSMKRK
jgi:hypothetical protein